jgi:hypothetical protein
MRKETVYISGAISKNPHYFDDFKKAEQTLRENGFEKILTPTLLPDNLEYEQYMTVCFAMIDVSDLVYMIADWEQSHGATREYYYALSKHKQFIYV